MSELVDGVMVANAALAEVGLPSAIHRYQGRLSTPGGVATSAEAESFYRAAMLGWLAESGPDHLVRCRVCWPYGLQRGTVPCTPARDALRGITCEPTP